MIHLSKTKKMPCPSWSLEAGPTCPGSINPETKEPYPVCANCYAQKGFYRMPNVVKPRKENRKGWRNDGWVNEMVSKIKDEPFFRWFDSGDCYHPSLAYKILGVMKATPNTKHWLPTKMLGVSKEIDNVMKMMQALPNVVVRHSSKYIDEYEVGEHGSVVFSKDNFDKYEDGNYGWMCKSSKQEGKCLDCRACWDKEVGLVIYKEH